MRPIVIALPALIALAFVANAQALSPAASANPAASDCNPEWGPFDPCLYFCGPPGSYHCRVLEGVLIIGGATWDCHVDPTC